jgi:heavy metal translocating P-type ATPase
MDTTARRIRNINRALISGALAALAGGLALSFLGHASASHWVWSLGAAPVAVALAVSILRDLWAGRMGVDAIALVSIIGALLLDQPLAAIVVAIMYAGGTALEDFAVTRAQRDLTALINRAPRIAHRLQGETLSDIGVEAIAQGDVLVVRAGEIVPADGVVESGSALIDESALTGEPLPVLRPHGDRLRSGCTNAGETFRMCATATAGDSTYAAILRLVTAAQSARAPFIRMADRFAILLLPVTFLLSGVAWFVSGDPLRALAVFVTATPCPLILAAPVAFIAGVSQAARLGVLIKGGGPLEALARVRTVVFDKTGTLTVGGARLIAIEAAPGAKADDVLRLAASLEQASHHVVAATVVAAAQARDLALDMPRQVHETMGSGLEGMVGDKRVRIGSHALVFASRKPDAWAARVLRRASWRSALAIFVSVDGQGVGALLMGDELRRETPRAVKMMRHAGVSRLLMVTGDRAEAAETIGAALDLDAVLADRSPADKVDAVAAEQRRAPVLMVGDGINDAPALAAAHVGVAMASRGASASSQAADVVVLVDRIDRVAEALVIARRTRAIALQSIVAGMALSGIAMAAAAFGAITPVEGALFQEGVDVAVILNALRALRPAPGMGRASRIAPESAAQLRLEHEKLEVALNRLRILADALDDASPQAAVRVIGEAQALVQNEIVRHEENDESVIYPHLAIANSPALSAMSRAHREILHLARLLERLASDLPAVEADRYLVRDAQRVIEAIESLVRMHNAQEEDIYEANGAR